MVNSKNVKTIRDFVEKNGMQLTLQAVGVVVLILNLWLTTKLAPLGESIRELTTRVFALEDKRNVDDVNTDVLMERFWKLEERVANIDRTTTRIESKLDQNNNR